MRKLVRLYLILFAVGLSPALGQRLDVQAQTRRFLDDYARQDVQAVLNKVDQQTVVYGSDMEEVFHGPAEIRSMIENDARLWNGHAFIGAMRDVTTIEAAGFASIYFQADFSVGGAPLPVRFCMTWVWKKKRWILAQSSNAVVTTHQSAAELLRGPVPARPRTPAPTPQSTAPRFR